MSYKSSTSRVPHAFVPFMLGSFYLLPTVSATVLFSSTSAGINPGTLNWAWQDVGDLVGLQQKGKARKAHIAETASTPEQFRRAEAAIKSHKGEGVPWWPDA